jgi:signal recognition particle subunit SEC65
MEQNKLPNEVVKKILKARDALVLGDRDEAYHQLYGIASPQYDQYFPWRELEHQVNYQEYSVGQTKDGFELSKELAATRARANNMEKALREIALQRTCAEQEADEDTPIGSDGTRLGDINMGYDCCIERAREAVSDLPKEAEPEPLSEPFNPDLLKVMQESEKNKEQFLKEVKERIKTEQVMKFVRATEFEYKPRHYYNAKLNGSPVVGYFDVAPFLDQGPTDVFIQRNNGGQIFRNNWDLLEILDESGSEPEPVMKWVKATEKLPQPFNVVACKYTPDSPDPRQDTELHWGFVSNEGKWLKGWEHHQIEWLDEGKEGGKP